MNLSVQISSAQLRLHEVGRWGSPYIWCCGIASDPIDPTVVVLGPTLSAPPFSSLPVIGKELWALGFRKAKWERFKNGRVVFNTVDISRYEQRAKSRQEGRHGS